MAAAKVTPISPGTANSATASSSVQPVQVLWHAKSELKKAVSARHTAPLLPCTLLAGRLGLPGLSVQRPSEQAQGDSGLPERLGWRLTQAGSVATRAMLPVQKKRLLLKAFGHDGLPFRSNKKVILPLIHWLASSFLVPFYVLCNNVVNLHQPNPSRESFALYAHFDLHCRLRSVAANHWRRLYLTHSKSSRCLPSFLNSFYLHDCASYKFYVTTLTNHVQRDF